MTTNGRNTLALFAVVYSSAVALVTVYDVRPVKCSWSGRTRTLAGRDYISQIVTCNFDELNSVELFVGTRGDERTYRASVLKDGTEVTWSSGSQTQNKSWVEFDNWSTHAAYTKGQKYEFRFTQSGSDSIQYYYQDDDPYECGQLVAPSPHDPILLPWDLAMRVLGRLKPVDSLTWGTTCIIPDHWKDPLPRHLWSDSVRALGAKWGTIYLRWNQLEPHHNTFDFWDLDAHIRFVAESAGLQPVGILQWSPLWASTRIDTSQVGAHPGFRVDTSPYAPPRGLWASGDSNLWSRYLDSLLDHVDVWEYLQGHRKWYPADSIHTWSIWSESNDGATTWVYGDSFPGYTGSWRRPNRDYCVSPSAHDMCSLYVRLCVVAESTIKSHVGRNGRPGHENDRIVIGELARVNYENDSLSLVPGREWLRTFYDIADRVLDSHRFWHVVSAHPYQTYSSVFDPAELESDIDTLRTIMREHHDTAQLWNTEFNYGLRDWMSGETNANSLGEACTSILADGGSTSGTFDRACWWLSWASSDNAVWALLHGDTMVPYPNYYAFRQTASTLTANRFSRRVMGRDTAVDNHVRMYEFEDTTAQEKRMWVCWRNGGLGPGTISTKLPVRTDRLVGESLAYSSRTPEFSPKVSTDGWLRLDLDERPVFITENAAPSRPDLRVDSVCYDGRSRSVRAWVTNHGTAATPVRSWRRAYPTWAVLRADGDSVGQAVWSKYIGVGQGAEFRFELRRTELPDTALLSVTVNPDQTFVELETDDNTGYTLKAEP